MSPPRRAAKARNLFDPFRLYSAARKRYRNAARCAHASGSVLIFCGGFVSMVGKALLLYSSGIYKGEKHERAQKKILRLGLCGRGRYPRGDPAARKKPGRALRHQVLRRDARAP